MMCEALEGVQHPKSWGRADGQPYSPSYPTPSQRRSTALIPSSSPAMG